MGPSVMTNTFGCEVFFCKPDLHWLVCVRTPYCRLAPKPISWKLPRERGCSYCSAVQFNLCSGWQAVKGNFLFSAEGEDRQENDPGRQIGHSLHYGLNIRERNTIGPA